MTRKIVVLGGTLSGPTAAARARELDERAEITIVQRGTHVGFDFAGLAHYLSGEVASIDALDREGAAFFEDFYAVRVRTNTEAVALDTKARELRVTRDGAIETLAYDALIFALGARSLRLDGIVGKNVHELRTLADVAAIRDAIAAGVRRVAIVGGGTFGLEALDGVTRAGAHATLIEARGQLLPRFGTQIARTLERHLRNVATVHLGVEVARAERAGERVVALQLTDGTRVETELVIVCVGVAPRTELLAAAGVPLRPDRSVAIDSRAETAVPGLFACGSCVAVATVVTGNYAWWPQAAIADKAAQVAGANAAGGSDRMVAATGAMLVRAMDHAVGRTGLSHDEAVAAFGGGEIDRTLVESSSHDRYLPHAHPVLLELIARRSTGQLLGAEAIGRAGVDKRIDVASVAVFAGLTVAQLARLDLGYAAPFASSRDPVNVAASVAEAERAGLGKSFTPAELREAKGVQLIDVRESGAGGIPNARHLPLAQLRARLATLDATVPTVVYSTRGRRGWLAVRILRQHGFADVANLAGGLDAWQREQA